MKKHTDAVHTKEVSYKCKKCGYNQYWLHQIVSHLQVKHDIKADHALHYREVGKREEEEVAPKEAVHAIQENGDTKEETKNLGGGNFDGNFGQLEKI